jgi:hypothetical protein
MHMSKLPAILQYQNAAVLIGLRARAREAVKERGCETRTVCFVRVCRAVLVGPV